MFGKRKNKKKVNAMVAVGEESTHNKVASGARFQSRPRICLIDVEESVCESLKESGFNCFAGTLGPVVEVPNRNRRDQHICHPHLKLPLNLHEYDIVVIDLQGSKRVPYRAEDHTLSENPDHEQVALISSFPQTLFDPRPLAAAILRRSLEPLLKRETVFLVFAGQNVIGEYQPVRITPHDTGRLSRETHSIYDFFPGLPPLQNISGEDTTVLISPDTHLGRVLHRHNEEAKYHIAFSHPSRWENNQRVKDDNFVPLMMAGDEQVISFVYMREKNYGIFFPQIRDKKTFVTDLLRNALPAMFPRIFPYSSTFVWLTDPSYRLPNEEGLLLEKAGFQAEYEGRMKQIDERITANHDQYRYLHDLMTQSGKELVKTVEKYLRWLEFDDVVNCDEVNPGDLEEDLQVATKTGLLVVEVKGIGGTSTDAECSQINKVKYRRAQERGRFDVHGIYIVNHQRFLPPAARVNPPFTENQVKDALNEDRGLLTTYDLFKLHFSIAAGFVTKEDARSALWQAGIVRFAPSKAVEVPGSYEIHHKGCVVVLRLDGMPIKRGMEIILEDNGSYRRSIIEEIQIDGTPVDTVESGEVGMRLADKVTKITRLWLPRVP